MDPVTRDLLEEGHRALLAGDLEAARATLDELASTVPAAGTGGDTDAFPPALVLAAQVDLVDGRAGAAQARLEPAAGDLPDYTALQVTLGRAADQAGDLVVAYVAFSRAAADHDASFQRSAEMRPRVLEILSRRVEDALERASGATGRAAERHVEDAVEALELLTTWLPDEPVTLLSAVDVAAARDDRTGELEALRLLVPRLQEGAGEWEGVERRPLTERQAELELEVGDSKTGLDLLTGLAADYPDDPNLAERLAFAKFRWRVDQMPPRVAQAASLPVLQRGDMAVLLYWLVPRVRSAGGGQARIASDILDDPRREEIARVLNLGLMDLDTAVYRFGPQRQVPRMVAIDAVLRTLRRFGGATCTPPPATGGATTAPSEAPAPSAVDPDTGPDEPTATPATFLCRSGVECGLLSDVADCRPRQPVSGAEAVDLIRRALGWMAEHGS